MKLMCLMSTQDPKLSDRLICQAEIHNRQKLNPAYLIKYKMRKKNWLGRSSWKKYVAKFCWQKC